MTNLVEIAPGTNPPYTLKDLKIVSEDGKTFALTFTLEGELFEDHGGVGYTLPFSALRQHIAQYHPEADCYLKSVRASIRGYFGPAEGQLIPLLLEDGFDVAFFLRAFIDKHMDLPLTVKKLKEAETQEGAGHLDMSIGQVDSYEEEDLGPNAPNGDELANLYMEGLHQLTLKHFPEFFDTSAENLQHLEEILSGLAAEVSYSLQYLVGKVRDERDAVLAKDK